jgi:dolichyl-phosphate beta-glucosyltransferase
MAAATCYVVPCYNEASRLDVPEWVALAATGACELLFVDDGSTDETFAVLEQMCASSRSMRAIRRSPNQGKAEAVRAGLLDAMSAGGTALVGYTDADLATPPAEILRLGEYLDQHPGVDMVMGSRIAFLGAKIDRSPARHYLGRFFATGASIALRKPVYDTQCGAKVFRVDDRLRAACREPFRSGWAFDVELLARLLNGDPAYVAHEVPLREWRDVGGSKVTVRGMVKGAVQLAALALRYRVIEPRRSSTRG